VFACSIHEVAAHRQGSHNQEIPRCGCGIKQDSEPQVTCRRSHNHSVSEIQRESLIEDVDSEKPAKEVASRHASLFYLPCLTIESRRTS